MGVGFGANQRFSDAEVLYLMRSLAGVHFVNAVRLDDAFYFCLGHFEDVVDTSSDGLSVWQI